MILHVYVPHTPHTYGTFLHHHSGQGLFSVFGRLFAKIAGKTASKVAAKAALKAAASAGKAVAKKALKTAAKEGLSLAKEGLKQGLSEATKYGTQATLHGIDSLAKKAVSKGAPAETTQLISQVIKNGAEKAAKQIASKATTELSSGIDKIASKHNLVSPSSASHTLYTISSPSTKSIKRKRKPTAGEKQSSKGPKKKKTYHKSLSTLIDQS